MSYRVTLYISETVQNRDVVYYRLPAWGDVSPIE